jgi:hypothetical protein
MGDRRVPTLSPQAAVPLQILGVCDIVPGLLQTTEYAEMFAKAPGLAGCLPFIQSALRNELVCLRKERGLTRQQVAVRWSGHRPS